MATTTKKTQLVSDTSMGAGLQQNQGTLPSFMIVGKQRAPAECLAVVQARIAAENLVLTTRGQWLAAVKASDEEQANSKQFVVELTQQLVAYYSATNPAALPQYGLAPKKARAPRSPVTNVVAAAKSQATRVERGTRSKKANEAIKGKAPATVTIAVETGTVSTTAPAPAPAAPPAATPGATAAAAPGTNGTHT